MHLVDRQFMLSSLNEGYRVANGLIIGTRKKKICIYGAGLGRQEAPLDDASWEVWALNTVPPLDRKGRLRASIWFDLHQKCAQSADDLRWIAQCPVPIYVPDDLLDVGPNCVCYPIERVRCEVADGPFACTFTYQISLAMLEGFREIGLYGVELAYGTARERTLELASVSWWMGYAEAKGVTFHLPSSSRLGTHPFRYGLDYQNEIRDVNGYLDLVETCDRHEATLNRSRSSVGG